MCLVRARPEHRHSQMLTVPGTRSFHLFVPLTLSVITAKRVSSDEKFSIKYDVIMGRNVSNVDISEIKVSELGRFVCDEQLLIDHHHHHYKLVYCWHTKVIINN